MRTLTSTECSLVSAGSLQEQINMPQILIGSATLFVSGLKFGFERMAFVAIATVGVLGVMI